MQLKDSNIVLTGGFNPHIIQPEWLARHGVVDVGPTPDTKVKFSLVAKRMRFELDGFRWEVSESRILVGSAERKSPGRKLSRLLELLPHTPISAVGVNFSATCPRSSWKHSVPTLPLQSELVDAIGSPTVSSLTTQSVLPDNTHVNLNLHCTESEVTLDLNFHRGVQDADLAASTEKIRSALAEYDDDLKRLDSIIAVFCDKEAD